MGSYHTTSNSPYQFNLFSGDQKVGALRYKSWFSQSARIRIAPDEEYRIDAGAWRGVKIISSVQTDIRLTYALRWRGIQLTISIGGQEQHSEYN